jgi:hypothetical protein
LLHLVLAGEVSVLINTIDLILIRDKAILMRIAISAHGHVRALVTIFPSSSGIDGASLISDVVVVDVLESVNGLTSRATEIFVLTRNDDLGRNVDVGPSGFSLDLDSI